MAERQSLATNPFFVLGLLPTCTRAGMEREGQKWLAMLEVGFAEAATYATPFGSRERTPELVRESMAVLRDPDRRLLAELWARTPVSLVDRAPDDGVRGIEAGVESAGECASGGWHGAMKAMGWK